MKTTKLNAMQVGFLVTVLSPLAYCVVKFVVLGIGFALGMNN